MKGLLEKFEENATNIQRLKAERLTLTNEMDERAKKYILCKHAKDMACIEDFDVDSEKTTLYLSECRILYFYNVFIHDAWCIQFHGLNGSSADVSIRGRMEDDDRLNADDRLFIMKHWDDLVQLAEPLASEWRDYKYDRAKYIRENFEEMKSHKK